MWMVVPDRRREPERRLGTDRAPDGRGVRRSGRALPGVLRCADAHPQLGRAPMFAGPAEGSAGRAWRSSPEWIGRRCRPRRSSSAKDRGAWRGSAAARSPRVPGTTRPTPCPPRRRGRWPRPSRHAASDRSTAGRRATADRTHGESGATMSRRPMRIRPERPRKLGERSLFERRDKLGDLHVVAAGDHVNRLTLMQRGDRLSQPDRYV